MKINMLKLFTLFFCMTSLSLFADITDSGTGQTFPSQVSFENAGKKYNLNATGTSTRKKFFVKVYGVAHYLQDGAYKSGADKFQVILSDQFAKQLSLKWVHDADAKRIQEGYHESFQKTLSPQDYNQMLNDINQYVSFFNANFQKGDEHEIRWIPGGIIEVNYNGKKVGSVTNPNFARALWSIWFGEKSVVNRDNLTNLLN